MLCQKCNKNPANLHFEQNLNGHKTEIHLCHECAAEMGMKAMSGLGVDMNGLLEGIIGNMFGSDLAFDSFFENNNRLSGSVCSECGTDLRSLGDSSFLGCPNCYEAFDSFIEKNLGRFQRGSRHTGKRPGGARPIREEKPQKKEMSEADRLRAELKEAIKCENYEKAAELRDKIRELGDK